jgi:hypothetical protein
VEHSSETHAKTRPKNRTAIVPNNQGIAKSSSSVASSPEGFATTSVVLTWEKCELVKGPTMTQERSSTSRSKTRDLLPASSDVGFPEASGQQQVGLRLPGAFGDFTGVFSYYKIKALHSGLHDP